MITFGVDIGKSSHYAVAVDNKGISLCSPFAFDNNEDGFNILLNQIDRFQKIDTICIGMEATGHYWLNLYCALLNRSFELHVINPILTDAMRRMSVRKTKTDTVDCKYIADVIRMGDFSDIVIQDSDKQNLKQLCRFRSTLVDETAAIKNRFIAVLDQIYYI
jgi:transposase